MFCWCFEQPLLYFYLYSTVSKAVFLFPYPWYVDKSVDVSYTLGYDVLKVGFIVLLNELSNLGIYERTKLNKVFTSMQRMKTMAQNVSRKQRIAKPVSRF